jgi:hypothetical protein
VKKIAFSMAVSLMLFVLLPTLAESRSASTEVNIGDIQPPVGIYEISVFKKGQWQRVGILRFNKYLREQKIDLGQYYPSDGKIRLRLTQKGGGAAHVDSVSVGGTPPSDINCSDERLALKKLLKRDFDVLDVFNKSLELNFTGINKDKILKVTARVEPEVISKTPFQFPSENLFRPINQNSKFFKFRLQPPKSPLSTAIFEKIKSPFFSEFCRTGSGHPHGFTYGWVDNDQKNLYATLEFIPDNTRDGDKDYAQLHIKTAAGIKSFKVSEVTGIWGYPDFTYTDKAAYQHKVYHFEIPFSEIGVDQPQPGQELLLAFSAYGTATPGEMQSSVAFDSSNDKVFIVYNRLSDGPPFNMLIYGLLVDMNASGATGPEITISDPTSTADEINPVVSYDSINQRYLVVWENTINGILYRWYRPDGSAESNIPFSLGSGSNPDLAYDAFNDQHLIVWNDINASAEYLIYGQRLDFSLLDVSNGLRGSQITI